LASSQSLLPLLRLSIPIGWRLRLLREISRNKRKRQPIGMLGRSETKVCADALYDNLHKASSIGSF